MLYLQDKLLLIMSFESGPEHREEVSDLESLKGDIYAHFPVVEKGETSPKYSEAFTQNLKDNWESVCDLMHWFNLEGRAISWENFLVSSDPEALVRSVQEKINSEGGFLSEFGMDGKFGPETVRELRKVVQVEAIYSFDEARDDLDFTLDEFEMSDEEIERDEEMRAHFMAILQSGDRAMRRIETAGLEFDKMTSIDELDLSREALSRYREDSVGFRNELVREEPNLRIVADLVDEAIILIESVLGQIDFSQIKSTEDMIDLVQGLKPMVKSGFEALEDDYGEDELHNALLASDPEIIMTYMLSVIAELAYIIMSEIHEDGSSPEELTQIFVDEGFLPNLDGFQEEPEVIRV